MAASGNEAQAVGCAMQELSRAEDSAAVFVAHYEVRAWGQPPLTDVPGSAVAAGMLWSTQ